MLLEKLDLRAKEPEAARDLIAAGHPYLATLLALSWILRAPIIVVLLAILRSSM